MTKADMIESARKKIKIHIANALRQEALNARKVSASGIVYILKKGVRNE